MNKITYLFGAGASAKALPLVLQIPFHLGVFAGYLEKHIALPGIDEYIKDIRSLQLELSEHNTIDSFAKALSQNKVVPNNLKLKRLKSILCGLFLFEQLKKRKDAFDPIKIIQKEHLYTNENLEQISRTIDPRYQNFFAKVVEDGKLDERINIISWNYDLQLEIGLERNLGSEYSELINTCSIFPHPSCDLKKNDPFSDIIIGVSGKSPQIIKLNGTAGIFLRNDKFYCVYVNQNEYFDDHVDTLIEIHHDISRYDKFLPYLRFAWEKDELSKKAINYANISLRQTQVLVVVGYSFPDFNRSVDREIFKDAQINEIYIQVPASDFETVKYNMQASFQKAERIAKHHGNLNEFFIPHQF